MKRKYIGLILSILLVVPFLAGCSLLGGQESNVDMSIADQVIKDDLKSKFLEMGLTVEEISSFSYEEGELTEEDNAFLTDAFGTQKASVQKLVVSFKTTSLAQDMSGKYSLIYAYLTTGWTAINGYPEGLESWSYVAKDKTSDVLIREAIKGLEFEGFEAGQIGGELNTSLEVKDRVTSLEMGKDKITLSVKYNAGFAIYDIGVSLQFEFSKGNWELTTWQIDDKTFWTTSYEESQKPPEPKDEYIIGALSNSSQYNTYMMSLAFVDNYYLTKNQSISDENKIDYNYTLIVTYDYLGDIEYNVTKQYIYQNNQWEEGPLNVEIKSVNLNQMIDTWSSANGDFMTFRKTEGNTLTGIYTHKYDNDHHVTYGIQGILDVTMADNNWRLDITKTSIQSGNELQEIVIFPFNFDFATDTLVSNGSIFKAEGDDPYNDNSSLHWIDEDPATTNRIDPEYTPPVEDQPSEPTVTSVPEYYDNTPTETTITEYDSGLNFF